MINVSINSTPNIALIYLLSAGRQTGNWFVTHGARHTQPHKAERRTFRIDTARTHIFSMKRQQSIYDLAGMCNRNLIFILEEGNLYSKRFDIMRRTCREKTWEQQRKDFLFFF